MQKESDRLSNNITSILTTVMTADEIARGYETQFGVSLRNEMRKCGYGNMREVLEGMSGIERIGGGPNPSYRCIGRSNDELTPLRSVRRIEHERVALIRRAQSSPDYMKLLSNCVIFNKQQNYSEFIIPTDLQMHSRDDPVLVTLPISLHSISGITSALSQQGVDFRIQGSSSATAVDICNLFVTPDAISIVDQLQSTPSRRC